jgi:hypothetical protein
VSEVVRRDEAEAALAARRELGPEYEDHVVDAFVERVEERLAKRRDETPAPRKHEPPALVVPLASLGMSIPLLGIAGGTSGLAGIAFVCLMIAIVNLAYAFARSRG